MYWFHEFREVSVLIVFDIMHLSKLCPTTCIGGGKRDYWGN